MTFRDGRVGEGRLDFLVPNDYHPFPGQVATQLEPDGTLRTFDYERGTFLGVAGAIRETVTQGTAASPNGIPFKTTRSQSIRDEDWRVIRTEEHVYVGSGNYELIGWKNFVYDPHNGRLTSTLASNGVTTSTSWGCCSPESTTDEEGIVTTTVYDDAGRVDYSERAGITTSYVYDGAGRALTTTRSAGTPLPPRRRMPDSCRRVSPRRSRTGPEPFGR